jgi:hypothetical protein
MFNRIANALFDLVAYFSDGSAGFRRPGPGPLPPGGVGSPCV